MSLTSALADILLRSAPALAVHWLDRISAALPRAEPAGAERDAPEVRFERAERVIDAIVRALAAGPVTGGSAGADALTLAGWEYGVAAHMQGRALHDLLQDFDLLLAIVLHESEQAVDGAPLVAPGEPDEMLHPSAADAFRAARRLHEAVALTSLAAAAGHAQETSGLLRLRFRTLRHDLRNPLSTIQNVVSLMEDASMPAETRHDPRYTGMLHRNAEALGDLIARELGEGGVGAGAGIRPVSIGAVAMAVRRSLRTDLGAADAEIEMDSALPIATVDATAVALALRALFAAALRVIPAGTTLRLHAPPPAERPAGSSGTAPAEPQRTRGDRGPRPMLRLAIDGPFVAPSATVAPNAGDRAVDDQTPDDAEPGDATPDAAATVADLPDADVESFASAVEVVTRVGGSLLLLDGQIRLELPVVDSAPGGR